MLKTDETARLFETLADDSGDKNVKLPLVALSRGKDIELLSNIKSLQSFNGLAIAKSSAITAQLNVIPISVSYQLDIYTKTYEEGDEYVRNFLFKLINNPQIVIDIPYNDAWVRHTANIRVDSSVSDTSDITEHLFAGQFTRWSIKFELQDAFLFNVPHKKNWRIWIDEKEYLYYSSTLEIYNDVGYKNLISSEEIPVGLVKMG